MMCHMCKSREIQYTVFTSSCGSLTADLYDPVELDLTEKKTVL